MKYAFFIIQSGGWVLNPVNVLLVCLFGSEAGSSAATPEDMLILPAHVSQCFSVVPTAADHRDSPMVASVPTAAILHSTALWGQTFTEGHKQLFYNLFRIGE